jgi:hypothetical protein
MSVEAAPNIQPDQVEAGLRDLWRSSNPSHRRAASPARVSNNDQMAEAVQAAAVPAINEVERTIQELTEVRDMLRIEAERVQREIAAYQALAQAAGTSMKVITDSLAQWKRPR